MSSYNYCLILQLYFQAVLVPLSTLSIFIVRNSRFFFLLVIVDFHDGDISIEIFKDIICFEKNFSNISFSGQNISCNKHNSVQTILILIILG